MHTASSPFVRFRSETVTREDLLELAKFSDEQSHALSFFFSLAGTPNNSHREEVIAVKRLIQEVEEHLAPEPVPHALKKDLEELHTVVEEIRLNPARFRGVFACREKQLWREVELPGPDSMRQLHLGNHFHLFPLLTALESCAPYSVVIMEIGKARAFAVRGTDIQEIPGRLPSEDLSLHADDSRVGWSNHIDKNVEEHEQAYFRKLAHALRALMAGQPSPHLVMGCRDDLWGEIAPLLSDFEKGACLGHFHLPSIAAGPAEILPMATEVFKRAQQQRCLDLLREINERPARAALGVAETLQVLAEGRAQKLIVASLPHQTVSECKDCGRMQSEAGTNCVFCGNGEMRYIAAEEGLIRQALLTGAEILTVATSAVPGFGGAAALLRY